MTNELDQTAIKEICAGYLDAVEFAHSLDEDEWDECDGFAPETIEYLTKVCADWCHANEALIVGALALPGVTWGQIGHDLWLTQNGHGAGFWDGDYGPGDLGDKLTVAAKALGEIDLYVGDDGRIYHTHHTAAVGG